SNHSHRPIVHRGTVPVAPSISTHSCSKNCVRGAHRKAKLKMSPLLWSLPTRPCEPSRLLSRPAWRRRPPSTAWGDRKSTRLNSSHVSISYAVFCLKKKKQHTDMVQNGLVYRHPVYT